jgi:hypothetical protein
MSTNNTAPKGRPWTSRIVITAGVAALAWAWSCDTGPQPREGLHSPGKSGVQEVAKADELAAQHSEHRAPQAGDAGLATHREILSEYWADGWPTVEAELTAAGFDFEARRALESWAEVEEDARLAIKLPDGHSREMAKNRMGWQEPLTNEWLVQSFGLQRALLDEELAELHELARPFNHDLESMTADYVSEIGQAVDSAIEQGRYQHAPLASRAKQDDDKGRAFLATSAIVRGWSVNLDLYEKDHPQLVTLGREISAVRSERNSRVIDYLGAH